MTDQIVKTRYSEKEKTYLQLIVCDKNVSKIEHCPRRNSGFRYTEVYRYSCFEDVLKRFLAM
jgi:hypothetical protein